MRIISNLLRKEVKELVTPQMFVPFLTIMVIFFFIGRGIRGERAKASAPQKVLVADYDQSDLSKEIIQSLKQGLNIIETDEDEDRILERAKKEGISLVIIIPKGLAKQLADKETAEIIQYNLVKGFSATQAMRGIRIMSYFQSINNRIASDYLKKAYPTTDPEKLRTPLRTKEYVMVKDKIAEGNPRMLQGIVLSQFFIIPVILLMTIIYVSQMIAVSIGQEKENKTLETLLTVPIKRVQIVIGKMLGVVVVALIIAGISMFAFGYYMGSFGDISQTARQAGSDLMQQLGLGIGIEGIGLIVLSLFLAILSALSLATLLAVFSDDAKSAQAAITPLMILCLIPYFFTLLFDVETASLPIKIIVYLIPFAYPFLTPKALIFGNYNLIIFGYIYMALFSAVTIILAARIFNSDRILTAKLRFRRLRKKRE